MCGWCGCKDVVSPRFLLIYCGVLSVFQFCFFAKHGTNPEARKYAHTYGYGLTII
jgi:hypothetical protein